MKAWLILLTVGASLSLISCASAPSPNPWGSVEIPGEPATQPTALPDWPQPIDFTEGTVTFDLEGAGRLESWRVIALGNTEIAAAHADQVDDLRDAAGSLVEAGKAQRTVADLRLEILEEERRAHTVEKIGLWAMVVLVIAGAAVL
jgi:hypothetical protein